MLYSYRLLISYFSYQKLNVPWCVKISSYETCLVCWFVVSYFVTCPVSWYRFDVSFKQNIIFPFQTPSAGLSVHHCFSRCIHASLISESCCMLWHWQHWLHCSPVLWSFSPIMAPCIHESRYVYYQELFPIFSCMLQISHTDMAMQIEKKVTMSFISWH